MIVSVAALFIALATLVVSTIMSSRTLTRAADAQHVSNLENELATARQEIASHEERLQQCERDRRSLREEVRRLTNREIELMRRLTAVENNQ